MLSTHSMPTLLARLFPSRFSFSASERLDSGYTDYSSSSSSSSSASTSPSSHGSHLDRKSSPPCAPPSSSSSSSCPSSPEHNLIGSCSIATSTSSHRHHQHRVPAEALAGCTDPNERRARIAVIQTVRRPPRFLSRASTTFVAVIGFGGNGCVVAIKTTAHPEHEHLALKIIYKRSPKQHHSSSSSNAEIECLRSLPAHPSIITHIASSSCCDSAEEDDYCYHYCYLLTSLPLTTLTLNTCIATATTLVPLKATHHDNNTAAPSPIPLLPCAADLWMLTKTRGRTSASDARRIARQLVDAVAHLHAHGIVHGDLKEENVVVDPATLQATLIDFGHAGPSRTRIRKYGTREMAAPEMRHPADGHPRTADAMSADVFALGLVLFAMLHGPGCLPRAARDPAAAVLPELDGSYPLGQMRPGLPDDLVQCLRGCTMVDPQRRWTIGDVRACRWLTSAD